MSITQRQILTDLKVFVGKESGFSFSSDTDDDTDLQSLGLVDSLLMVSLMSFCEQQFGCTVDLEDFIEENFKSFRTLAELIQRKLPTVPAASDHREAPVVEVGDPGPKRAS